MKATNNEVLDQLSDCFEQGLIDAIGDAISIQDTNFKVLYQNQIHKDIIGDHNGAFCYKVYEGRDHICEGCPVNMSFRDGQIHKAERSTADGKIEVEITSSVLRNSSGDIIAGIEVVRDITERNNLKRQILKYNDELELKVQERTNELIKVNNLLLDEIVEREKLEQTIIGIEERELRNIGNELHDSLGQLLTGCALNLQGVVNNLEANKVEGIEDLKTVLSILQKTKKEVSRISKGLLPLDIYNEGLMAALAELVSYSSSLFNVSCDFRCDKPVSIQNSTISIQLYRIAQEAITNAIKHGKAEHIIVTLIKDNGVINLTVKDDGIGISEMPNKSKGLGIKIMHHRANLIDASINLSGGIKGTLLTCAVPAEALQSMK